MIGWDSSGTVFFAAARDAPRFWHRSAAQQAVKQHFPGTAPLSTLESSNEAAQLFRRLENQELVKLEDHPQEMVVGMATARKYVGRA